MVQKAPFSQDKIEHRLFMIALVIAKQRERAGKAAPSQPINALMGLSKAKYYNELRGL
jgi:hypothetical protein